MSKLQPLRVTSGWIIEWNTFMESDPHPENMNDFSGSSLLHASHEHRKRALNLEWKSEEDFNGEFLLRVINLYEEFNSTTQKIDLIGHWENPFYEFRSKSRLEVVDEIERLMLQLDSYVDPRIMESPGVVDDIAESLRIELANNGITDPLAEQILSTENKIIQDLLIDHISVRRIDLEQLVELGATKGIKKKAAQKLNSKAFRSR